MSLKVPTTDMAPPFGMPSFPDYMGGAALFWMEGEKQGEQVCEGVREPRFTWLDLASGWGGRGGS